MSAIASGLNPTAALLVTTLGASLLGSLHCAGMCGGLVAFTAGFDAAKRPSLVSTQSAYHVGRLLSYTALGAIAGSVGAALDLTGRYTGVQRSASIVAGAAIALVGLIALLRAAGVRIPKAPVPAPLIGLARQVHVRALRLPPLARAITVGLATPLLPCGWLYAFVAIAAGANGALAGSAVMIAFWIGTLPALFAVAGGLRAAAGPLRRALPVISGIAMLAVGLHVACVRGPLAQQVASATVVAPTSEVIDQAAHAGDELPACCRGGA
ncbi:MAG: sulfite exporter TauE/SafE family protein [Phycisphaerae bacterium]|nr:sulfite exporter TauE/SafE family protein [Phycisphaerae bacterium]